MSNLNVVNPLIANLQRQFRDFRFVLILISLCVMLLAFLIPSTTIKKPVFHLTFIIDITRSMNARDYTLDGKPVSRLTFVQEQLKATVLDLPCQSTISLGIFTDRQSTLLFSPLEVCASRSDITQVIDALDWRMAWAADSRIAKGLFNTIEMLDNNPSTIVFVTDGQEAPPVNPRYKTDFSPLKNKSHGLVLGVGGLVNVAIPKFDSKGNQTGFYQVDDVPHRSTFGIPAQLSNNAGNYHARNAPFGGALLKGDQHMTRLYESYLKEISAAAGWKYARMDEEGRWRTELLSNRFAVNQSGDLILKPYYSLITLLLLVIVYFPVLGIKRPLKKNH